MSCRQSTRISACKIPEDVERLIFEEAVRSDDATSWCSTFPTAANLVLVARRVRHWIEPTLYHFIPARRLSQFLACMHRYPKPASFYASHVKAVYISSDSKAFDSRALQRLLSLCTGLEDIYFWIDWKRSRISRRHITQLASSLRLRRLVVCNPLSDFRGLGGTKPNFNCPFFQCITHLFLADHWERWTSWSGWQLMPNLTHLSLTMSHLAASQAHFVTDAVRDIMSNCKRLEFMIVRVHPHSTVNFLSPIEDSRLVVVLRAQAKLGDTSQDNYYTDLWESHLCGGKDIWPSC